MVCNLQFKPRHLVVFLVLLSVIAIVVQCMLPVSVAVAPMQELEFGKDSAAIKMPQELLHLRDESSKTFDLGGGKRRLKEKEEKMEDRLLDINEITQEIIDRQSWETIGS